MNPASLLRALRIAGGTAKAHALDTVGLASRRAQLGDGERAFIEANAPLWSHGHGDRLDGGAAAGAGTAGVCVVEGFLARSGPNYLLRTGMLAKALEERIGVTPVVVLDEHEAKAGPARALYESFGITRFFHAKSGADDDAAFHARAAAGTLAFARKQRGPDDLLALTIDGVRVGDLAYDELIREKKTYTITGVDADVLRKVYVAHLIVLRLARVFRRHRVTHALVTHGTYLPYGILARLAAKHRAAIFETTDQHVATFAPGQVPCFHESMRNAVLRERRRVTDVSAALTEASALLDERFAGKPNQIDVQLAFANKRTYDDAALRAALGIRDDKPFVFVMSHALADSPHLSATMLHRDYLEWLREVVASSVASHATHVVVKTHPSASLYGEGAVVANFARDSGAHVCPADFSTASLPRVARAVFTSQGTVGLELPGFGVPVVTAGRAFYTNLGFTIDPATREELRRHAANAHALPRPTTAQRDEAKLTFLAFHRALRNSALATPDVLAQTWGYHGAADVDGAFKAVAARLSREAIRAEPAWHTTMELLDEAEQRGAR